MPYDESVADRVRSVLKRRTGLTERKMFGGLAFLHHGNMCCGVLNNKLVLRLGNELSTEVLKKPHTESMNFTGRPMKSMVYVQPAGFKTDASLRKWIELALKFARTLPPKLLASGKCPQGR